MIECQNLSLSYQGNLVLENINITIASSGVTALIGPNGAGKSTLLALIARLLQPQTGQVLLNGTPITQLTGNMLARRLAILRQDNHMEARLTVVELVRFGRYPHSGGRLTDNCMKKVNAAIRFLELEELCDRYLDELSGGQRQRAYIAMALAQDTDYILLDEPLNNLDIKHAVSMMKLMKTAARDMDKKIIVVLHDINFASVYADEIIAMKGGKISRQGTPTSILTEQVMTDLYGLPMQIKEINNKPIAVYHF